MNRSERWALFGKYALGLILLVIMYLLLTVVRSVRSDFATELWQDLGEPAGAAMFTRSEVFVALGVLAVNGTSVLIRDNRLAFFASLATCCLGFVLLTVALLGQQAGALTAMPFMILAGLGLLLPYVAIHTTVFERLLAMMRERGNLGFLMYVADAFGYLGYVAVMFLRYLWTGGDSFLQFFIWMCWLTAGLSLVCLFFSWRFFAERSIRPSVATSTEGAA